MSALPIAFAFSLLMAQEKPPAPAVPQIPAAPQTPAVPQTIVQQIAALKQEFDAAHETFDAKYSAAKTDEERNQVVESDYPRPEKYAPRFLELAAQAKGEPAALDCFLWVLQRVQDETTRAPIYAALAADHLKSPKLGDAVRLLGRYTASVAAEKFLRAVVAATPHEEVKGAATYSLAGVLLALSQLCETIASPAWTPELQARDEGFYGKEMLEELAARDPQELAKEAQDLLEDVVAGAKSVKSLQPLATQAAGDLYELRNLSIGQVAPEVSGFDVDAVHFNLSDYRGKVVVLDFWGFW